MPDRRKMLFKTLMRDVVTDNLSHTQTELFDLEGDELIDALFKNGQTTSSHVSSENSYGFSPQVLSAIQTSAAFVGVIAAFFKVYIDYIELKVKKRENVHDDLKIYESLEVKLKEHNLPPELRDKLSQKYSKKMAEIIESL
jgi:hypothetical protein